MAFPLAALLPALAGIFGGGAAAGGAAAAAAPAVAPALGAGAQPAIPLAAASSVPGLEAPAAEAAAPKPKGLDIMNGVAKEENKKAYKSPDLAFGRNFKGQ